MAAEHRDKFSAAEQTESSRSGILILSVFVTLLYTYFQKILKSSFVHTPAVTQVSITRHNDWNRKRRRGRNRDENRQRELQRMCCAGILCRGVDMSPGISSAHAQVSLSDLYEHPHSTAGHTHTHTHQINPLQLQTHKHFLWASKINIADSRLTRRMNALPCAKCVLTPTLFIKLRTPHICETLWSEIENTSCIFCWWCLSIWLC